MAQRQASTGFASSKLPALDTGDVATDPNIKSSNGGHQHNVEEHRQYDIIDLTFTDDEDDHKVGMTGFKLWA